MSFNPYGGFNPLLNHSALANGLGGSSCYRAPLPLLPQGAMNWPIPLSGGSLLPATVVIPSFPSELGPGTLGKSAPELPIGPSDSVPRAASPPKTNWLSLLAVAALGGLVGYLSRGRQEESSDTEEDFEQLAEPPASEKGLASRAPAGNSEGRLGDGPGFSLPKRGQKVEATQTELPFSRVFSQNTPQAEAAQPKRQFQKKG